MMYTLKSSPISKSGFKSPRRKGSLVANYIYLKGLCVIFEDVLSDIVMRDKRDSERATAPLKPADDALVIDTSDMTADDVYAQVVRYIEGRIN